MPKNTTKRLRVRPNPPIVIEEIPIAQVIPQEEPNPAKKRLTLKIKPKKIDINDKSQIKLSPTTNMAASKNIESFKTIGLTVLESLSEKQLGDMLIAANDAYYNTKTSLMTDNEYDIVKEYIEKKYPKNAAIAQVGAPIQGKNKVQLPYNMPSMDKIKPDTNALTTWKTKYTGPYVLSCKLDGVSGMFDTETKKLYTRGDGKVGQDISHLVSTLGLDMKTNASNPIVVRGEFIIPKKVFEDKYKSTFANPCN
jgi:hypothetical protein